MAINRSKPDLVELLASRQETELRISTECVVMHIVTKLSLHCLLPAVAGNVASFNFIPQFNVPAYFHGVEGLGIFMKFHI